MTDDERLAWLEAEAEKAYGKIYDLSSHGNAGASYNDAKEFLADAIALAHRLGRAEDVERLAARLDHIKSIFRSQFS